MKLDKQSVEKSFQILHRKNSVLYAPGVAIYEGELTQTNRNDRKEILHVYGTYKI